MHEYTKKMIEKSSLEAVFATFPEEKGYSIFLGDAVDQNKTVDNSILNSAFQVLPAFSHMKIQELQLMLKNNYIALNEVALNILAKKEEIAHTISWLKHHKVEHRVEEHRERSHIFIVSDAALGIEFEISEAEISHRAEQWNDIDIN